MFFRIKLYFTFLVSAIDSLFAYNNRNSFAEWELNPVALWFHQQGRLMWLISFKLASLALFALLLPLLKPAWRLRAVNFVALVHLGLLALYFAGVLYGL